MPNPELGQTRSVQGPSVASSGAEGARDDGGRARPLCLGLRIAEHLENACEDLREVEAGAASLASWTDGNTATGRGGAVGAACSRSRSRVARHAELRLAVEGLLTDLSRDRRVHRVWHRA